MHRRFLKENGGKFTSGRKAKCRFLLTCFTGSVDFIVVRYSISNNNLPSNNRFHSQDNILKVSRIHTCRVLAPALISDDQER
jgi:hypothetical protein